MVRCSLDDFIANNQHEVRVSPYSETVEFRGIDYRVPPGALFDLHVLKGKGLILESLNVREGTDLSKGLGSATILDRKGKRTGYSLTSHGGMDPASGEQHFAYYIEDERRYKSERERLDNCLKRLERSQAVFERYKDVKI